VNTVSRGYKGDDATECLPIVLLQEGKQGTRKIKTRMTQHPGGRTKLWKVTGTSQWPYHVQIPPRLYRVSLSCEASPGQKPGYEASETSVEPLQLTSAQW